MNEFNIGATVKVKGILGPVMVVTSSTYGEATVIWFDTHRRICRDTIATDLLKPAVSAYVDSDDEGLE